MRAASTSPRIKGSVLQSRLNWVKKVGGEVRLQRVLQRLPEEERSVLQGVLQPISWFPMELGVRLDSAIAAVLFPGEPERAFVEMGRASAEENLGGPHHVFIRKGDPHFLLSCAPQIYRLYYAVGARTYERVGERAAVLRTLGAQGVTAEDCLTIVGWHERAIELCGGRNVQVRHPVCRAQGKTYCEYHCAWE